MLGVNIEPYCSIKRRVLIYFKCWESIVYPIFILESNFGCSSSIIKHIQKYYVWWGTLSFRFGESIVHHIFVLNFGCQYKTLCLKQSSGVDIDAAPASSWYFGWHIEILSQHYVIIVDNDLPEYLWTFQSQGSAGIAQAKRVRRTPLGVLAWVNWIPEIIAKAFLSRNLAFLLAARWPPTLVPDGWHRLRFCLVFFDRFLVPENYIAPI